MKQGFTLIELLIVVIIVGMLVTIALPKYQRALERARALEGINNIQYAVEFTQAKQIMNDSDTLTANDTELIKQDLIKVKYFDPPTISMGTVTITRKADSGWHYSLTATAEDGVLNSVTCSNTTQVDDCEALGFGNSNLMDQQ